MSKHFIISPYASPVDKKEIEAIRVDKETTLKSGDELREQLAFDAMGEEDFDLKCTEGRVVVKIHDQNKNFHTFEDGTKIRRERQFNELNRRITEPVNCFVIDSEFIPKGVQILIHPNEICDANRIFGYKDISPDVKYYSIKEDQCFLWLDEGDLWNTLPPYETALRVYEPYKGMMQGVEPTLVKDTLYCTSGELSGNIVMTLKASDYEVIYQGVNGREERVIRFRPFGDIKNGRDEEAIAILDEYTNRLKNGELLIGISAKEATTLN